MGLSAVQRVLVFALGGATNFAKLRSKIAKCPKIGRKVCAPAPFTAESAGAIILSLSAFLVQSFVVR